MKLSKILRLLLCFYLPLIIFLIHVFIIGTFNLYEMYPWLDIPMHFFGGMSITFSFILVLDKCKEEIVIKDKLIKVIILVSLVTFTSVLWEFWEQAVNYLFNLGWTFTLKDTLKDLFIGIFGGLMIAIFSKS